MDKNNFILELTDVADCYAERACPIALAPYMVPAFKDGAKWAFDFIAAEASTAQDKDNPPSEPINQQAMETKEKNTLFPVVVYTSDDDKRDDKPTYLGQIIHIMSYGGGKVIAVVRIVKVYKHMPETPTHWHRPDSLQTFFVTSLCAIREGTRYAKDYEDAMKIKNCNDPRIFRSTKDEKGHEGQKKVCANCKHGTLLTQYKHPRIAHCEYAQYPDENQVADVASCKNHEWK